MTNQVNNQSIIPSTDVMTTAQVVETLVTANNNSPVQDYVHPDDQTQPTFEMTPGFKPFTAEASLSAREKTRETVDWRPRKLRFQQREKTLRGRVLVVTYINIPFKIS